MNIVFDLGGVVFTWNPRELINQYFTNKDDQELMWTHLLTHQDWWDLDRGTLGYEDAAMRTEERTGIPANKIMSLLDGVPSALQPVPEMVRLVEEVKSGGHKIYLLSNMHTSAAKELDNFDFMDFFNGKLYSCRVNQVKPDREIYETLLKKFKLNPQKTLFIDDTFENLEEPGILGIKTIHFRNPRQCRENLKKWGVFQHND